MKYFMYEYEKVTNSRKLYLLSNINKRYDLPVRTVIWNCSTTTEKVLDFLDHRLKRIMQDGWSYIKDTKDFLDKIQNMGKISEDSMLVTLMW